MHEMLVIGGLFVTQSAIARRFPAIDTSAIPGALKSMASIRRRWMESLEKLYASADGVTVNGDNIQADFPRARPRVASTAADRTSEQIAAVEQWAQDVADFATDPDTKERFGPAPNFVSFVLLIQLDCLILDSLLYLNQHRCQRTGRSQRFLLSGLSLFVRLASLCCLPRPPPLQS